ncbi:hypothetical protein BKA65DRAFT_518470 [Rhexocercosporidium sp. MPI-PUGE-AT-0058]|nr:hypothetical protein BKA65DRAFT_518470 [Rhexocercosporidium sp. MPI-PUGE-AT-0058]
MPSSSDSPPFGRYFEIVAFTATITISISVSASQGLATGQSLFGIPFGSSSDSSTPGLSQKITTSARVFSWSAAASTVSLMISMFLQLLLTDPRFIEPLTSTNPTLRGGLFMKMLFIGSMISLVLQAASLALIGEGLKVINEQSGEMIQWSLLGTGILPLVVYGYLFLSPKPPETKIQANVEAAITPPPPSNPASVAI